MQISSIWVLIKRYNWRVVLASLLLLGAHFTTSIYTRRNLTICKIYKN